MVAEHYLIDYSHCGVRYWCFTYIEAVIYGMAEESRLPGKHKYPLKWDCNQGNEIPLHLSVTKVTFSARAIAIDKERDMQKLS